MNFFKSPRPKVAWIDLHSHILPGLDDGAKTLEHSTRMMALLVEFGAAHIIATPHYRMSRYMPDHLQINSVYQDFLSLPENRKIPVTLGNEIYLDSLWTHTRTLQDFLFLDAARTHILLECPFEECDPEFLFNAIYEVQKQGLTIVFAHPERILQMQRKPHLYHDLVDRGVLLQINLPSLAGFYGPKCLAAANYLLDNNLVFGCGSDAHHVAQIQATFPRAIDRILKRIGREAFCQMNAHVHRTLKLNLEEDLWN